MANELPKARIITIKKWMDVDGYGMVINNKKENGYFKIKSTEPNMPASCAGIMINDYIIKVNGVDGGVQFNLL